jgi:hypothetical protein
LTSGGAARIVATVRFRALPLIALGAAAAGCGGPGASSARMRPAWHTVLPAGEVVGVEGGVRIHVMLQRHAMPNVPSSSGSDAVVERCRYAIVATVRRLRERSGRPDVAVVAEGLPRLGTGRYPEPGSAPLSGSGVGAALAGAPGVFLYGFEIPEEHEAGASLDRDERALVAQAARARAAGAEADARAAEEALGELELRFDVNSIARGALALETATAVAAARADRSAVLIIGASHWGELSAITRILTEREHARIALVPYRCRGV